MDFEELLKTDKTGRKIYEAGLDDNAIKNGFDYKRAFDKLIEYRMNREYVFRAGISENWRKYYFDYELGFDALLRSSGDSSALIKAGSNDIWADEGFNYDYAVKMMYLRDTGGKDICEISTIPKWINSGAIDKKKAFEHILEVDKTGECIYRIGSGLGIISDVFDYRKAFRVLRNIEGAEKYVFLAGFDRVWEEEYYEAHKYVMKLISHFYENYEVPYFRTKYDKMYDLLDIEFGYYNYDNFSEFVDITKIINMLDVDEVIQEVIDASVVRFTKKGGTGLASEYIENHDYDLKESLRIAGEKKMDFNDLDITVLANLHYEKAVTKIINEILRPIEDKIKAVLDLPYIID